MRIADWPSAERPRERLLAHGASVLSDAELLAIFLRTGMRGKSALDLARELITEHGSLARLAAADCKTLTSTAGIGPAKAAQLQAALELARRALGEKMRVRDALSSPQSVRDYLRLTLAGRDYEVFMAVLLDAQNRVIAAQELFRGTLTQTSVYPREVVKFALAQGAAGIIFAHNHPSGLAEPNQADELLTRTLRQALALVDIRVLDHFIVGEGAAMSFAERGLI